MRELYQQYLPLTAGQRKLLCFLAYTGAVIDSRVISLYANAEELTREKVKHTLNTLTSYFEDFSYFRDEYQLDICHTAPLFIYMMKEMPQWLTHFESFYLRVQLPRQREILLNIQRCMNGERQLPFKKLDAMDYHHMLVPLVSYPQFLNLMKEIPSHYMLSFVSEAAVWQIVHDIADPDNLLGQVAKMVSSKMGPVNWGKCKSIVALYDFYKQGRYDEEAASLKNLFSYILKGAKALYDGDYEVAFKQLTVAIRENNKTSVSWQKGFFNMPLNNLMLVMAYHFNTSDEKKKLHALLNKEGFRTSAYSKSIVWLAQYLADGNEPSSASVKSEYKNQALPLHQYLAQIAARFFHIETDKGEDVKATPNIWLLRQELSGKAPALMSRIRHKQRWELLLEELTPKGSQTTDTQEQTSRVVYIFNYSWVELREQTRLKSGEWSAGKKLSWDNLKRGTLFMDETDRRIAQALGSGYYYDINIDRVLPYLIGSNRVFTGHYAPLTPVTIVEEKPYLIIERSKTAFSVKSNLGNAKMDGTTVYRKDSDTHYTVISITPLQRNYYRRLLEIGVFPLEAEQALREFLPKVSHVVEVHSDLVEGGTTLDHRDGTAQLCLQALPSLSAKDLFDVCCFSRPLTDGPTLLTPGKGLNPCVAEQDGVRYQTTRDMKGERANLQILCTFLDDNGMLDDSVAEPFSDRMPVTLTAEGLLQLMEFVKDESDRYYMEWPEGGQLRLKSSNPASWNISLRSKNGWFEVEGEIPIDDDTVLTTAQLLQIVAESPKGKFIRLGENDFLRISDRLRKQLQRIESLTVTDHGHLQISELHASLLGSALSGEVEVKHDERIEELQQKIKKSMALAPAAPKQLKAELRDYQTDGFQWMTRMTDWGSGVCLADDMGLGKTVQTIAFMLQTSDDGPALVAAPASVVLNWRRELERFAPTLNVIVLNSAPNRHDAIDGATKGDVVLTTYGLFVTEADDLLGKQWNTVCLDEAHVIKNRETKTSASVMKLQAKNRIILTGTPVQNHLGELWNLYQFINPGLLGSYEQFQKKYIQPIELQQDKERSKQLKRIVQPFILRRTKQEVIEELPDKTEITMPVELSDDEMAVYEVIRRRAKKLLEDEQGGPLSVNTLAEITRLRQAACAAQLAEKSMTGESSKIQTLLSLLEEIVGGGNSVLVFSQFTSFLALVREALDKAKTEYLYLDGSIAMKKREQLVQSFQHGDCPVFLISLKAGGLGLNLTGANYVIHLDPWWNPAIEQQATDRAYRIGQRQNVTVYHLISQHTIEEKILRLHETKRNLADAMLEGTSESHKLTAKELMEMIGQE